MVVLSYGEVYVLFVGFDVMMYVFGFECVVDVLDGGVVFIC